MKIAKEKNKIFNLISVFDTLFKILNECQSSPSLTEWLDCPSTYLLIKEKKQKHFAHNFSNCQNPISKYIKKGGILTFNKKK